MANSLWIWLLFDIEQIQKVTFAAQKVAVQQLEGEGRTKNLWEEGESF